MRRVLRKAWGEDDGVLTFEWTLLVTLLVIGIVSGVAAVRDGIIDELGDVAQMMLAVDQSYLVSSPLNVDIHSVDASASSDSIFTDALLFTDCDRDISFGGQRGGAGEDDGFPDEL